jgi:hypothetical protein
MIGMNNGRLYQWYQRHLLWPILKDPVISGEAIYYLAAAPEMAEASGRFFNLTIDEKPAVHALDRSLGERVWKISEELAGLSAEEELPPTGAFLQAQPVTMNERSCRGL